MHGDSTVAGVFMGRRSNDWRPLPAVLVILLLGMVLAAGLLGQALRPQQLANAGTDAGRHSASRSPVARDVTSAGASLREGVSAMAGNASRPRLDLERARAVVLRQPGVVSAIWLDGTRLLARVNGVAAYTSDNLRAVCRALAEAGDNGGVQVQLQNARARNSRELEPLVLQCGTPSAPVERAALAPAVAPAVREVYQGLAPADPVQTRARADAAMRVIRRSTPEAR